MRCGFGIHHRHLHRAQSAAHRDRRPTRLGLEEISSKNAMGIGSDPEVFFALNAIDWTAASSTRPCPPSKTDRGCWWPIGSKPPKGTTSVTPSPSSRSGNESSPSWALCRRPVGSGHPAVRGPRSLLRVRCFNRDSWIEGSFSEVFGNNEVHLLQANLLRESPTPKQNCIAEAAPVWCSARDDGFGNH